MELACKFSNPKARVSWYKNKLEVFQGLKYKLTNEDGVFRLYINNAAMEDAGKYTCQANNLETSCYLTVEGIRSSVTGQLADTPTRGLDISRTGQLAD